jgi:hypothetical protein
MVKPPIAKRLMGASLGTGVAIALEVTREVAALVLEAPQRLRKRRIALIEHCVVLTDVK